MSVSTFHLGIQFRSCVSRIYHKQASVSIPIQLLWPETEVLVGRVSITASQIGQRSSVSPGGGMKSKLDVLLEEVRQIEDEPLSAEYDPGGVDPSSIQYDDDGDW